MSKLFSTGICKKLCGEPNCTSWVVGKEDKLKYQHLCNYHHWLHSGNNTIKPKKINSELKICTNTNCLAAIRKERTYCAKCYKLQNDIELLPSDLR